MNQDLNSNWVFQGVGDINWLPAMVPGCVHLDLLNNNNITDPFYGNNENDLQWISERDWVYKLDFIPDPMLLKKQKIILLFNGLDTYANVFLNGKKIIESYNMFRRWKKDIKGILLDGTNELLVQFESPIKKILPNLETLEYDLPADNDQIKKTSPYTRKAPYHYGWDWGPSFATSGIWKSVSLVGVGDWEIETSHITQLNCSEDTAELMLEMDISSVVGVDCDIVINNKKHNILISESHQLKIGNNKIYQKFKIDSPRLWWPNGHGEPYLYEFDIEVNSGSCSEKFFKRIGLRDVEVLTEKDGSGVGFTFQINRKKIFAKGANWIPADSFVTRIKEKDYRKLLQSSIDANMNMLRVWGGGIYESDQFYDLCDEMGILVWQDFMFACSMYPGDLAFIDNVEQEAKYQIGRLKEHPCIAIWCGNNEITWAWHKWGWKEKLPEKIYEKDYKNLFHKLLPSICSELDPNRLYWPSSPGDGESFPENGPRSESGDSHFWGVWHEGENFSVYDQNIGRFMSEFGMQSFPNPVTIDSFTDEKNRELYSDVIQAHQKASLGNANVEKYVNMYYKPPKDFDSFATVSQIMAAEAIRIAVESYRVAMPYCMGSLYWQLNDCWPGVSWSSLDYFGGWKAIHYAAVDFYAPVLLSIKEVKDKIIFYVVCDREDGKSATLSMEMYNFDGELLKEEQAYFTLPLNNSQSIYEIEKTVLFGTLSTCEILLRSEVFSDDLVIAKKDSIFVKPRDLILPEQNIRHTYKIVNGKHIIYIKSAVFSYKVHAHCLNDSGKFSNNYFEMLPGEEQEIEYFPSENVWSKGKDTPLVFRVGTMSGLVK